MFLAVGRIAEAEEVFEPGGDVDDCSAVGEGFETVLAADGILQSAIACYRAEKD